MIDRIEVPFRQPDPAEAERRVLELLQKPGACIYRPDGLQNFHSDDGKRHGAFMLLAARVNELAAAGVLQKDGPDRYVLAKGGAA